MHATSEPAEERDSTGDSLLNFGPVSTRWLHSAGLYTREDLQRRGTEEVFLALLEVGAPKNAILLYAIEGAITNTHWAKIPTERKAQLRKFANKIEGPGRVRS